MRKKSLRNKRHLIIFVMLWLLLCVSHTSTLAEEPFDCGDGLRYKIEVKEFAIKYSGITFEGAFQTLSKLKIRGIVEEKTLQMAAESTQQWNHLLIGLAEGYNSCAITKKQYQEAIQSLYPEIKVDAQKILDIAKTLEKGQKADIKELKRLIDEYLQNLTKIARLSGKEDIIERISENVAKEHEKTREYIASLANKIDCLKKSEKDIIIAELWQKLQETRKELQKRGTSEALKKFEHGNFDEAEQLFQKELQEEKAKSARAAYYLGNIRFAKLDFKNAADYYSKAAQLEPYNSDYLNSAGLLLYTMGKYADAETIFKQSLEIRENILGKNHTDVATSLNNLARLYHDQGKYVEASPLFKRSLEIYEKTLGKDHPYVATSLSNLARLYHDQGKYGDAEPLFKRAMDIRENILGKDHPDVAASLNSLARLYHDQGKYADAEPLLKQSLEIYEKTLGKDHPYVAASLNSLARLYHDQGRYTDAETLFTRALEIREKILGNDHPNMAILLNNVARLYHDQGRYADAETLLKRALEIYEKTLGKDHPDVAASLNSLARLYHDQGRDADAETLFQRSIKIYENTLGKDNPHVAAVMENLVALYKKNHNENEAKKLEERVNSIRSKKINSQL